MRIEKKSMILILFLFCALSLAGCNKEERNLESKKNIPMEYYKGEKLNYPEKLLYVKEIMQVKDNHYLLVGGETGGDGFLWETTDGGEHWEKKIDRPDKLKEDVLIEAAVINEESIFCAFMGKDLKGGANYYLVSEEGEFQEIVLEETDSDTDSLASMEYKDSLVYGKTIDGNVVAFDPYTGKKMHTYVMSTLFVNMYCVMDENIMLVGPKSVETYNIKSGERVEDNLFLETELYKLVSKNEKYYEFVRYWNGKVYYLTLDGMYELDGSKEQVNMIIDGEGQPFGDVNSYLCGFSRLGEEDWAISVIDSEKKSSTWCYACMP